MRNFIKQNPWFVAGLILVVFLGFLLVYGLGFWNMVRAVSPLTERLRDITFPIWDEYPFMSHGYLVFYSMSDFEEGVAYSNHSSVFLFFMYLLYKLEMHFPKLPMRAMAANLEMLFFVAMTLYAALHGRNEKIKLHQGLLIFLGVMFLLTMPTFWISAAKFNVDNPFHFLLPVLVWCAHGLSRGDVSGVRLWLPLGVLCVTSPTSGVLLGAYLAVSSIGKDGVGKKVFRLAVSLILIGVAVYIAPVLVSKILGFSSSNSGWRFRSGLDGDVSYFTNVFNAVVNPYFYRPEHLLVLPIGLLLAQLIFMAIRSVVSADGVLRLAGESAGRSRMFFGVLFSQYLITCLLWPQAISIHPYLYDYAILGPVFVWIVLNFAQSKTLADNPSPWIWIMLFFVSFNLQQIAQAKQCADCHYSSWNVKK